MWGGPEKPGATEAHATGVSPTNGPSASGSPAPSQTVTQLIKSASEHYDRAQAALKAGDFATYGSEIRALNDDLARLRALTGQ